MHGRHARILGQILSRFWPDFDQILARFWLDVGQILARLWQDVYQILTVLQGRKNTVLQFHRDGEKL